MHEYTRRLEARRATVARWERLHRHMGNARLALFVVAAVAGWWLSPWWSLPPLALLLVLVVLHERVVRSRSVAERAVAYYEKAVARLEDRWIGAGETGERFLDPAHPYAQDLDLFGRGSLFELISTARTQAGERTLAEWLLRPAPPPVVHARQAGVMELRDRLDLREDLAVLGENVRTGVHAEALAGWAEEAPVLVSPRARAAALALAFLTVLGAAAWVAWGWRPAFLAMLLADAAFAVALRLRVRHVVAAVEHAAQDLALLSEVLVRLEREPFTSPRLVELRAALEVEGRPPSHRIARLNRIIELLDSRDNLLMRIIGPMLLWTTQLAFAVEAWRRQSGPHVRGWLEALGEMEALSALAGYAYEHPSDVFPEFVEGIRFEGEAVAHPLLSRARAVPNDVRLNEETRVLIVSGSNMSGKSTLLRTVGTNAVLAQAGAPVRARRLLLSPLAVGASIRVVDSLQAGTSRLYAEITRIRQIVDLTAQPAAVLFLLDELLHGTNSHDRRIGAEAMMRGLVDRGAIGLITTHDLALAEMAGAANVHFEDHFEGGRMTFDYLLRPGVVRKSNALELMRSLGLEV